MKKEAVDLLRAFVETVAGLAPVVGFGVSFTVAPQDEKDDNHCSIGVEDGQSDLMGQDSTGALHYEDMARLNLRYTTPRGEGDSDLRTAIDYIKTNIQNKTVSPCLFIDDCDQDTPYEEEDAEYSILHSFNIRYQYTA